MKRLLSIIVVLATTCASSLYAQTVPTFSTDGSETWYIIQFRRGEAAIADQGEGANLRTVEVDKTNDAQLWKLTGSVDTCEIISKSGRHIYFNNDRYAASSTKTGSLKLVKTTTSEFAPAWEIQSKAIAGKSINQWGGYGAGRDLDESFGLIETAEKAAEIYLKIAHLPWRSTITDEAMLQIAEHYGLKLREGYLA